MRGGVEEVFAEGDEFLVAHFFDEGVDTHGRNEFLVADGFAIFEGDDFVVGVHFLDGPVGAELGVFFGKGVGHGDPDTTGTTIGRKAEGGVWSPIAGCLLENDILGDGLQIWSCDTFTEPLALHLEDIRSDTKTVRGVIPWLLVRPRP